MSGFFRNTPSKKSNVFTFPPPDLGMLRRSRRVLIFPKSRCIIYFDLRGSTTVIWSQRRVKINLIYVPPRPSAHLLPNQRPVYFFTTVPAMEYPLNII